MFQVMPESAGKIMGIRATGKLTDQDYQFLTPTLSSLDSQVRQSPLTLLHG